MNDTSPPVKKKIRGSFFPPIKTSTGFTYQVSTVDGTELYYGYSEHVARLIMACMSPRIC